MMEVAVWGEEITDACTCILALRTVDAQPPSLGEPECDTTSSSEEKVPALCESMRSRSKTKIRKKERGTGAKVKRE